MYEVVEGKRRTVLTLSTLILMTCLLGYGLIMGSFSAGPLLLAAPTKLTLGFLASIGICLPSLYILVCVAGCRMTAPQVCGVLLASLSLFGVFLVGFAPITWVFSQSTESPTVMGIIHLLVILVSLFFALRLLEITFRSLSSINGWVLKLWSTMFIVVLFQMSTTLRPFLTGDSDLSPFILRSKRFFIDSWLGL